MPPRGMRALASAAALVSLLAVSACTAPEPPSPSASPDAGVPFLAEAVERLPERVDELLAQTGVPGLSVAVVHGDEAVFADGFGVADLDTGAAVDADTLFQLASVSKPVGASVIAGLIGRGALEWDTPVRDGLAGFALDDDWVSAHLTVGDLYAHRSGLPDHAGDDLASFGVERDVVLERLRYLPLSPFRDTYAYTNFGIQAGASAAASLAGGDWSALSDDVLYTPAGMTRTTSSHAEYLASDNHAVGHGAWGRPGVSPQQLDDDVATAAGGVASTANDLGRWLRMLLGGGALDGVQIVDADALATAMVGHMPMPMTPPDPAQPGSAYGQGFQIGMLAGSGDTFVSHSGAFSQGAGTMIAAVPGLDLGVAVLTNGFPQGLAETVVMEIIDMARHGELTADWASMYAEAFAHLSEVFPSAVAADPPAGARPPAPDDAYTGTYRSDYFGEADVAALDGGLRLTIAPVPAASQTWILQPYDGDVFRVLLDNDDAHPDSVSAVTFDPGAGSFVFEFFDDSSGGAGTFTRTE